MAWHSTKSSSEERVHTFLVCIMYSYDPRIAIQKWKGFVTFTLKYSANVYSTKVHLF